MLQKTCVEELRVLAAGGDAGAARRQRLRRPADRAAFALQQLAAEAPGPAQPCDCCGTLTVGFCEACLWRGKDVGVSNKVPLAVCSTCEGETLVCRACSSAGFDYDDARLRYKEAFPEAERREGFVIYGAEDASGAFVRFEEPKLLRMADLGFPAGSSIDVDELVTSGALRTDTASGEQARPKSQH